MQPEKSGRHEIDLETWDRRATFQFFKGFTEPLHGICVRVDCTETFQFAKEHRISVSFAIMHRCLVASHRIENFRTRIDGDSVWLYDRIDGGSAVGRPNGTIGFAYQAFDEDIREFVRTANLELERVRSRDDIQRSQELNFIRFSVLPWLDFTSLSHARDFTHNDSIPRITWGKISEAGGRRTMPISIHVHHALADGLHVAQFVERLQELFADPEKSIR